MAQFDIVKFIALLVAIAVVIGMMYFDSDLSIYIVIPAALVAYMVVTFSAMVVSRAAQKAKETK